MSTIRASSSPTRWSETASVWRRPALAAALLALLLAGLTWLAWQLQPALAVAALLDRAQRGVLLPSDLDAAALHGSLSPQVQLALDDEQATNRRWAAAGNAVRGTAAAFHLVMMLPVLVMEPLAPKAAARAKQVQAALLPEPPPAPPDTQRLAAQQARVLATGAGAAALIRAAFARAPETWPAGRFGQLRFVQARLLRTGDETLELPLEPSGIALGWRSRLSVLEFRRHSLWEWRLSGMRLPPSPAQARAVLDAAKPDT